MADISFEELDRALQEAETPITAAEVHGIMCGSLCVSAPEGGWETLILGRAAQTVSDSEAGRVLRAVYDQTQAWLDDNEMEFQLYVPDDERPLDERATAVADWCRGFMLGMAAGGVKSVEQLPENAQEVVRDFAAIAELTVDAPADEEQEQALTEIEEYMRVGAQLVYEELRDPGTDEGNPE